MYAVSLRNNLGLLLNVVRDFDSMARPFGLCHIAIGHITETWRRALKSAKLFTWLSPRIQKAKNDREARAPS